MGSQRRCELIRYGGVCGSRRDLPLAAPDEPQALASYRATAQPMAPREGEGKRRLRIYGEFIMLGPGAETVNKVVKASIQMALLEHRCNNGSGLACAPNTAGLVPCSRLRWRPESPRHKE